MFDDEVRFFSNSFKTVIEAKRVTGQFIKVQDFDLALFVLNSLLVNSLCSCLSVFYYWRNGKVMISIRHIKDLTHCRADLLKPLK